MDDVGHCVSCGITGTEAVLAEQQVAVLPRVSIYRHPACNHVVLYRSSGAPILPQQAEAIYG